jgi:hypothetical protein
MKSKKIKELEQKESFHWDMAQKQLDRMEELDEQRAKHQKEAEKAHNRIRRLQSVFYNKKVEEYFKDGLSAENVMKFDRTFLHLMGKKKSDELYKKITRFFDNLKGLHLAGQSLFYEGGEIVFIQFFCDIALNQNDSLEDQKDMLKLFPYIRKKTADEKSKKYTDDVDNCNVYNDNRDFKYIGIFEHTCSKDGVYFMRAYDDEVAIFKTAWGHTSKIKSFSDMEEALVYIYEKHPYIKLGESY